jgi:hypothetical protein
MRPLPDVGFSQRIIRQRRFRTEKKVSDVYNQPTRKTTGGRQVDEPVKDEIRPFGNAHEGQKGEHGAGQNGI